MRPRAPLTSPRPTPLLDEEASSIKKTRAALEHATDELVLPEYVLEPTEELPRLEPLF